MNKALTTQRTLWLILFIINLTMAVGSIVLERYFNYFPCYLCLFQRLLFMVSLVWALSGLLSVQIRFLRRLFAGLTVLTSIAGGATSIYMLWIQAQPKGAVSCQSESLGMIQTLIDTLGRHFPDYFLATGMCEDPAPLFGISLPTWGLAFFVISLLLALVLFIWRHPIRRSGLSFR